MWGLRVRIYDLSGHNGKLQVHQNLYLFQCLKANTTAFGA